MMKKAWLLLLAPVALGACGLIKKDLGTTSVHVAGGGNSILEGTVGADGNVTATGGGSLISTLNAPSIGSAQAVVDGSSWTTTFTVADDTAFPTAVRPMAGTTYTVELTNLTAQAYFYKGTDAAPNCGDNGAVTVFTGLSGSASATANDTNTSVTTTVTGAFDQANIDRINTFVNTLLDKSKDTANSWYVKACASGRITLNGSPAPMGATVSVTDLTLLLHTFGVL